MIPQAHGGRLVDRLLSPADRTRRESEVRDLPKITPFIDQIYDAEKLEEQDISHSRRGRGAGRGQILRQQRRIGERTNQDQRGL